jgi:hypothetical protein
MTIRKQTIKPKNYNHSKQTNEQTNRQTNKQTNTHTHTSIAEQATKQNTHLFLQNAMGQAKDETSNQRVELWAMRMLRRPGLCRSHVLCPHVPVRAVRTGWCIHGWMNPDFLDSFLQSCVDMPCSVMI